MRGVRERNRPRIPAEHAMGLANASAIDAYLLSHPDTVRCDDVAGSQV